MRMTMMMQGEEYDSDNGVQVREQLSTSDNQSNGRILDLKTGTVRIHRKHKKNIMNMMILRILRMIDEDHYLVVVQVKKEGSQSAMRLCMGSRRGFIARIKVGVLVMMVAVVVVIMVVGMMVLVVTTIKVVMMAVVVRP